VPLARRSVAGHLLVRRSSLQSIEHDEHGFVVDPEHRTTITVARQGLQAKYTRAKKPPPRRVRGRTGLSRRHG
jgi:hypothetical protein